MLDAKPTIFISHSSKYKDQVAVPFRDHIESLGMKAVLVEEMPHPSKTDPEPEAKVDYFLQGADMFIALLTPDDRIEGGEIRSRANIADEIGRAKSLPHLRHRIQVFKAPEVVVHSNINPTRETLDITNPVASFAAFERQAVEWGIMPRPGEDASSAVAGPIGPAENDPPEVSNGDDAAKQAGDALAELRAIILDLNHESSTPEPLAIRRAHLAASTALTSLASTSIYGIHELNGLYRIRAQLRLSADEVRHLLRSVIDHLDLNTGPGWYWLRSVSATECHEMLVELAAGDPNSDVRAKSLRLLAKARRALTPKQVKTLIQSGLDSGSSQIHRAALVLLAAKGNVRLLRQIATELGPDAQEAELEVRARETPSAALRTLVSGSYHHNEAVEMSLLASPKKLPASVLRSGLSASFFRTRILCLRGLERSRHMRRADLDPLLSDKNGKVRDEALRIAIRKSWRVKQEIADEIIRSSDLDFYETSELQLAYFETLTSEELNKRMKWIGGDGWNVYAALGLSGGKEAAERARIDLDSDFSAMRAGYRAEVRRAIEGKLFEENQELSLRKDKAHLEELIEQEITSFFGNRKDLDPFTLKRFQAAALRVLAKVGEPSDAAYARKLLFSNEHDVVVAAIRLLARFGKPKDAAKVIDASGQLYFENRVEGAQTGADLAKDKLKIAALMLSSEDDELRLIGIKSLEGTSNDEAKQTLIPLLKDESKSIRAAAIDQLARRLDRTERRDLLDTYPRGGYYFYNVVGRLDRNLYAPGWLQAALRNDQ